MIIRVKGKGGKYRFVPFGPFATRKVKKLY